MNGSKEKNNWEWKSLKYIFYYLMSSVDRRIKKEELDVYICHYPEVYNNEKIFNQVDLNKGTCTVKEFENFKLQKEDILITKDSEDPGDIGVPCLIKSDLQDSVCGYHLGILRTNKNIDREFYFRFIQSSYVKDYFFCQSNGVTRFGIGKPSVENLKIPIPCLEEQKTIACYIEKKTSQIDSLIEMLEKKIELLKQQKIALINKYITKGLDRNVEMKYSGIDWIGEIPKKWKLSKIKYLTNQITKGTTPSNIGETFSDSQEVRFIKGEDLIDQEVSTLGKTFITHEVNAKLKRSQLQNNDLLVVIAGTLGKTAIVKNKILPANTNQAISLLRFKNLIHASFVHFWLQSSFGQKQVNENAVISAQPNISMEDLGNFYLPLPPSEELDLINFVMKEKTELIMNLIKKIEEKIILLKEYRYSLISSVVTGKIRITKGMI